MPYKDKRTKEELLIALKEKDALILDLSNRLAASAPLSLLQEKERLIAQLRSKLVELAQEVESANYRAQKAEKELKDQLLFLQAARAEIKQQNENLLKKQKELLEHQQLIEKQRLELEKSSERIKSNEHAWAIALEENRLKESELHKQKDALERKNAEIIAQFDELHQAQQALLAQREAIQMQKNQLEQKNIELQENEKVLSESFEKLRISENEVRLKNKELELRQHQIIVQNSEFQIVQEELLTQREIIEYQNRQLQNTYTKITQGINYARTIQKAILPSREARHRILKDSFLIYLAKDIVSGDFFWVSEHDNTILVGVIDCTGHGVPGAFMSLVGTNLLNEIIHVNEIIEPDEILNRLHLGILQKLNQHEGKNNDGMDVALISINYEQSEKPQLKFAGAKNNLYLFREGQLEVYKGDRMNIGGAFGRISRKFNLKTIEVNLGDVLYLYSDGFADQASEMRVRFSNLRLVVLLKQIYMLSFADQKAKLLSALQEHQGHAEQRDDITFLGVKI